MRISLHLDLNMPRELHPIAQGSFIAKNTVPVACNGKIFPEYHYKLRELALAIDGQTSTAGMGVAHLAYEGWLSVDGLKSDRRDQAGRSVK